MKRALRHAAAFFQQISPEVSLIVRWHSDGGAAGPPPETVLPFQTGDQSDKLELEGGSKGSRETLEIAFQR